MTPATLKEVLEENFGGEQQNLAGINIRPNGRPMNRFTNAYMLVYIRESELDHVLAPVTEIDIPRHLAERIENEARLREQKRKEKEEQHLFMKVSIASDETFKNNYGFDFINFSEDNERLIQTRFRKDQFYGDFKRELAESIGLAPTDFRLWLMVNRQNRTIRIDIPIPEEEQESTLDEVRQKYATSQATLRFYLERAETVDEQGLAIFPTPGEEESILIFVKHFKPEHQVMHGLCHLYVRKDAKVNSIVNDLKAMIGLDEKEEILLFEEIKANMIDQVDPNATFAQSELQDGDILCVQKKLTLEEETIVLERGGKITVDDYMEYELGKVVVFFAPLSPDQESPDLRLILHKDMGYEEIATRVAMELNVDPKKLRLINPYLQGTTRNAATTNTKRFAGLKLGKLLSNAYPVTNPNLNNPAGQQQQKYKFYYEKLDVSLEEIESKCSVSVTVCTPTLKDTQVVDLLLPKDSGFDDLIGALSAKGVRFQAENGTRNVRIFDEMDGKFHKEYNDKSWREAVSTRPHVKVYAEEIPEEELDADNNDGYIRVFHYQRTPTRTHSVPFKFVYREVSFSLFLHVEAATN